MEENSAIVDTFHVFDDKYYAIKDTMIEDKLYFAQYKEEKQYYYLMRKGEVFNSKTKYSFLNQCEKSFELFHPAVLCLSGFSIQIPKLYYKYINNSVLFKYITLSDENIQILFYGVASGLSYLLSHGFFYENFSIDSIIFDSNKPKLYDYINFEDSNKENEKDMILKYADLLTFVIDKKKEEEPGLIINKELKKLIERCKQETNLPNFDDFINFFESKTFNNRKIESFKDYKKSFNDADVILCSRDDDISEIFNDINCTEDMPLFLNQLPEYYIKEIVGFYDDAYIRKLKKYLCYEDLTWIFPGWRKLLMQNQDQNPFKIYKELMNKINILEDKKKDQILHIKQKKEIDTKIDAYRIQAIYFLKKAYHQSNKTKIKVELAVQYINGVILPYNLNKALNILKEIVDKDTSTQKLIKQMIKKVESTIESLSIEKIIHKVPLDKQEILQNAEQGDVLSLLFCAFSFYTGFNEFPILHVLSIQFYRKAAKKSAHAMTLLGYLYLYGIIFPKNFKRAKKCFQRAEDGGSIKAIIMNNIYGKHLWRSYLVKCHKKDIFHHYLPYFHTVESRNSYISPYINYFLDENLGFQLALKNIDFDQNEKLYSEKINENCSMHFTVQYNIQPTKCPQKILITSANLSSNLEQLMENAKNFYYGEKNFPVNYSEAAKFFKLAADKGDSEAQWRYAVMCNQSLGIQKKEEDIEAYFTKSIKKNNIRGKLMFALYLKDNSDKHMFDQLLKECCDLGNTDAMYYYAMHLENIDKDLDQSMYYYQKSADNGHFDSLIRLLYILKHKSITDLYEKYLNLSVAIMNEPLLIRLIHYYNRKKQYEQSNILIQIGIKINCQLFNAYYADHLLYGKGFDVDEKKAEKFVILASRDKYKEKYWERYMYIMLEIYIRRKQHQNAANFLLNYGRFLTLKYRHLFLLFYKKFDKIIAHNNLITVNFCSDKYREVQDKMIQLIKKENINRPKILSEIREDALYWKNPYAMSLLGKMYKQGKYVLRNLKTAVQFFALSAKHKCPEGYYYLGKEYYYGRILNQDYDLAKENLILALEHYGEPRAGYYLYKIPGIRKDENVDDVECLKVSAFFGYKKALYKYGHRFITGKDDRIPIDVEKGNEYIKQSAKQNYKKAKRYCRFHGINYKNDDDSSEKVEKFVDIEISLKFGKFDEDISFSDIDSDTEDANIAKFINVIKDKKGNINETKKKDETDLQNENDKIYDLIDMFSKENIHNENESENKSNIINSSDSEIINKDNKNISNLGDFTKDKKSDSKIDIDDDDSNSNLNNLTNDKKFFSKINIDDDDSNINQSNLTKDRRIFSKINIDDDSNANQSNLTKDKKNSTKVNFEVDSNASQSNLTKDKRSSSKINIDDNLSTNLNNLTKDKRSSSKIKIDDDYSNINQSNLIKKRGSFSKINIDDDSNANQNNLTKDKKNSTKVNFEVDSNASQSNLIKDKKSSSKINTDDDSNANRSNLSKDKKNSTKVNFEVDSNTNQNSSKKGKKSFAKINIDDDSNVNQSNLTKDKRNSSRINIDDDSNASQSNLTKDKRSSSKIKIDDDDSNINQSSLTKDRKNFSKINIDDDSNANQNNLTKDKKNSTKVNFEVDSNASQSNLIKDKKNPTKVNFEVDSNAKLSSSEKDKKSSSKININDDLNSNQSNLTKNKKSSSKININDDLNSNQSNLTKNKKSSSKINIDDNLNSNQSNLAKNKKSSSKINIDDNLNSNQSNLTKNKKSSSKFFKIHFKNDSKKEKRDTSIINIDSNSSVNPNASKKEEKTTELSTDEVEDDISDLIEFWK